MLSITDLLCCAQDLLKRYFIFYHSFSHCLTIEFFFTDYLMIWSGNWNFDLFGAKLRSVVCYLHWSVENFSNQLGETFNYLINNWRTNQGFFWILEILGIPESVRRQFQFYSIKIEQIQDFFGGFFKIPRDSWDFFSDSLGILEILEKLSII